MSAPPDWTPDPGTIARANLTAAMRDHGIGDYDAFHRWSVTDRAAFWDDAVGRLGIVFDGERGRIVDPSGGVEEAVWLPDARLNIAASCFSGNDDHAAIVAADRGSIHRVTVGELRSLTSRVAAGLERLGLEKGSPVAIAMPMTVEAVAAYLGIVWAGGVVVSIADSFAPEEIATRLRITGATTVVTQDVVHRAGKTLPMYEKLRRAGAEVAVVVDTGASSGLRGGDVWWDDVVAVAGRPSPVVCGSGEFSNVLFSSGTTGEPKAIPWTQTTPIKGAVDGFYHQDIHRGDVVAWPTNLGWMMGPWLIYASLINGAAMALYDDAPTAAGFARFAEAAGVTMLGVVPSTVAAWRASGEMEGRDWSALRLLSSTGETSNPADMSYLMAVTGGKPVIEYCGGTELGGGYLTGTVLQPARAGTFTTPAVGVDIRILDDDGGDADTGELFLVPPSIGMSSTLLNRDHHEVYYAGTPSPGGQVLRRHGDHMRRLEGGGYRALGRVDDTMNLGGIKVGSSEIERVLGRVDGVSEVAAIAVAPETGGPSRLVVYAVAGGDAGADASLLRTAMQQQVREHLNPLFKIADVVVVGELPRTASAKVMRRTLRRWYLNEMADGADGPGEPVSR